MANANGILMRFFISCFVGNGSWIEDNDVGEVAFAQKAAAFEAEVSCRESSKLVYRTFQRQQFLFTNIFAEDPGEAAIGPWVWHCFQENSLRRLGRFVGAEANPRQADEFANVLFRCDEIQCADR